MIVEVIILLNEFVIYFLGALHEVAGVDPEYDSILAVIVLSTVLITACLAILVMLSGLSRAYFRR